MNYKHNTKTLSAKKAGLKWFLFIIPVLVLLSWSLFQIVNDNPHEFFPLDDPQGTYLITKNCPHGQGWIKPTNILGTAYCLEYSGNNVLMKQDHNNSQYFVITIGKADINLNEYVGKRVDNITGYFTNSDKQCIQNKCQEIGGPYVVVNINSLEFE